MRHDYGEAGGDWEVEDTGNSMSEGGPCGGAGAETMNSGGHGGQCVFPDML